MQKGAVTFLDILGWKGIWQRDNNPIEKLTKIIDDAKGFIDFAQGYKYPTNKSGSSGKARKSANSIFKGLSIDVISISDTIVLTTIGDRNLSLEFHAAISSKMICDSLFSLLPMRGATSYGDYKVNGNILLGPAIDEVASWYERAEWIGVMQTPSALYEIYPDYDPSNALIKHPVQIKDYGILETYCANWPNLWAFRGDDEKELYGLFAKMGPITPDISAKFNNTLKFFNESYSKARKEYAHLFKAKNTIKKK